VWKSLEDDLTTEATISEDAERTLTAIVDKARQDICG
jgi:hypothetical protein